MKKLLKSTFALALALSFALSMARPLIPAAPSRYTTIQLFSATLSREKVSN